MTTPDIQPVVEFAIQNKEWITLVGVLVLGAVGLTDKQRQAIKDRDENRCQSTDRRISCGGRIEVDHILPKEFAEKALKMRQHNNGHGYNDPENLLSKCLNHHRGHPNSHHPDILDASWREQNGEKGAIKKAVEAHGEKARKGQIYWNPENDGIDRTIAIARSEAEDKKKGGRKGWWPW